MTYEKPEVTVLTPEQVDEFVEASRCGSVAGSCYATCYVYGCTFTMKQNDAGETA